MNRTDDPILPDEKGCYLNSRLHQCCCSCQSHKPDHYHCGFVEPEQAKKLKEKIAPDKHCICSIQKGWVCISPISDRVYSGWPEHSLGCEMFIKKDSTSSEDIEI